MRRFEIDKRYLAPVLVTIVLIVGQVTFGFLESWSRTALAIATSIAVDPTGGVHIGYSVSGSPYALKYAYRATEGADWLIEFAEAGAGMFYGAAIGVDSQRQIHLAYPHRTAVPNQVPDYDLWFATRKAQPESTFFIPRAADTEGAVGLDPSIAIDKDDRVYVAHAKLSGGIRLATRAAGGSWSMRAFEGGDHPDVAIDSRGQVHLVYRSFGFKHWVRTACQ